MVLRKLSAQFLSVLVQGHGHFAMRFLMSRHLSLQILRGCGQFLEPAFRLFRVREDSQQMCATIRVRL